MEVILNSLDTPRSTSSLWPTTISGSSHHIDADSCGELPHGQRLALSGEVATSVQVVALGPLLPAVAVVAAVSAPVGIVHTALVVTSEEVHLRRAAERCSSDLVAGFDSAVSFFVAASLSSTIVLGPSVQFSVACTSSGREGPPHRSQTWCCRAPDAYHDRSSA
jgi:hypothetical protein